MTLRVGEQLLAVRADTDETLARVRERFGAWVDDEHGEHDVPPAFGLLLGPPPHGTGGPVPVPQLQHGRIVVARSRRPDEVLDALDGVLGGVLAAQDDSRTWIRLRLFADADRAVLLAAQPPVLVGDPQLARHGIDELATWSIAIDDAGTVSIPPPLTGGHDGDTAGEWATYALAGIVTIDDHPLAPGDQLTRFTSWHASASWFRVATELVEGGRSFVAPDRLAARDVVRNLLAD